MSFSIGIIGLPNVGKSTLFKALTKKQVEIAPYAFSTRDPNIGIVAVPDDRLEKIAKVIKPEKTTPTTIKFVDIAGLVKNAHKGEGLGNQFLSHIRICDAVVEVVRDFQDDEIEHIEGSLDPKRDIGIIKTELLMKDLETLEKVESLKRIKTAVAQGTLISDIECEEEEKSVIQEYQFLTAKPKVFVLNSAGCLPDKGKHPAEFLVLDLKIEQEISELSEDERKELNMQPNLDKLIKSCYNMLDLISFFTTTGGKETRAWTLQKDSDIIKAAEKVHSVFAEKFIKAKVIPWQKLVEGKPWKDAGKDYLVQDGDVIEFKI